MACGPRTCFPGWVRCGFSRLPHFRASSASSGITVLNFNSVCWGFHPMRCSDRVTVTSSSLVHDRRPLVMDGLINTFISTFQMGTLKHRETKYSFSTLTPSNLSELWIHLLKRKYLEIFFNNSDSSEIGWSILRF